MTIDLTPSQPAAASSPSQPAAASSLFPSLGPMGSAITSIVMVGATAVATASTTYLVNKGFVSADDAPKVITGIVALLIGVATAGYKMVTSRLGAKITAVAAVPGITVVAPASVAKSAEHVANPSVITPTEAAAQFGPSTPPR